MKKLALSLACLSLLGCSHDLHIMKTEEEMSSYGSAIRWGLFEKAADFQPPEKRTPVNMDFLKDIHVTSYSPTYRSEEDANSIIKQTVEIRYYREQTGVERTITDRQTWRFDKEKGRWFLESGLPTFK